MKKILENDEDNQNHEEDEESESDSGSHNDNRKGTEMVTSLKYEKDFKNIIFSKIKNNADKLISADLALIAAIKIICRVKYEKSLNTLFYNMTGRNLEECIKINIALDKSKMTNLITYTDTKVESLYIGKSINELNSKLVKLSELKINLPIIYTNNIHKNLKNILKASGRPIDLLGNGFENIYTHDIGTKRENPYKNSTIVFDRDYSIILRKELIESLNENKFDIDMLIKTDIELQFSKINYFSVFLNLFNKGRQYFINGDKSNAEKEFKEAFKLFKDDVIDYIIGNIRVN
jgi:hypothetical protein